MAGLVIKAQPPCIEIPYGSRDLYDSFIAIDPDLKNAPLIAMKDLTAVDIEALVRQSWDSGIRLDLKGIGYGRIHWGNFKDVSTTPSSYYYFLAGLVRETGIRRILEIGTHAGGSALAMQVGFGDSSGLIVTVDVTKASDKYLKNNDTIVKIRGDANDRKTLEQIMRILGDEPVDLLFIDGDHKFYPALLNYSIYSTLLRPGLVCLDDITLNEEMRRLWGFLKAGIPPGRTVNAAEVVPEIRPGTPGFGCIVAR